MFSWLLCFLEIACILGILTPSSSTINVEIQHAQINITWFPRKHLSFSPLALVKTICFPLMLSYMVNTTE